MKLLHVLLFSVQLLTVLVFSQCSNQITQQTCTEMNGCGWNSSTTEKCNPKVLCKDLSNVDCQQNQLSGQCNYQAGSPSSCSVQQSACKLVDGSQNQCTNPNSCIFTTRSVPTCEIVEENFKCDANKSSLSCQNASQCYWQTEVCSSNNKCESSSLDACNQSKCDLKITQCTLKVNAADICQFFSTQETCTKGGCLYNSDSKLCSPPQSCQVNNNTCATVCEPSQGTCKPKDSNCSPLSESSQCDMEYCQWILSPSPKCLNNQKYCQQDCDSKSPYCKASTVEKQSCYPNTEKNECMNLSDGACQANNVSDLCNFTPSVQEECTNQFGFCTTYDSVYCNKQAAKCVWVSSNVSSCSSLTPKSTSTAANLLSILSILAIATVFLL